jgi:hypothetical protein
MNRPHEPNDDFPFQKLTLANPHGLQGGAYFSKMKLDGEMLLIQTPKCTTKNGMHTTEKKVYCDLLLTDDHETFRKWLTDLEERVQCLIYEKREAWFHSEMDHDSIQYHWQSVLRRYKGDKHLLRCFIPRPKNARMRKQVLIFDEDESPLSIDAIDDKARLVSILEVTGLKFTTQSFQLEFCLRQAMILRNQDILGKCLIQFVKPEHELDAQPQEDGEKGEKTITNETEMSTEDTDVQEEVTEISADDVIPIESIKENLINKPPEEPKQTTPSSTDIPETGSLTGNATPIDPLVESTSLQEVELEMPDEGEEENNKLTLKNPNEVYIEIYKEARRRARVARKAAVQAYLEAKRIKTTYLLDDLESSDDDSDDSDKGEVDDS